jgi:DNA-binding transcriptional ArsR family regulator
MENPATPSVSLPGLSRVLGDPSRWAILRELGKGEPLPVNLIARRIGISEDSTSKHMAVIRKAGLAQAGLGRLYTLAPAYRPAPGATHIDFGHCLLRLSDTAPP